MLLAVSPDLITAVARSALPTVARILVDDSGTGVDLNPSVTDLPGSSVLSEITDGLASWALIAAMVGVVVGAVMWAFGHYSQNYQQAYMGRRGVMVSGLAAILIGAAPHLISFFFSQGTGA